METEKETILRAYFQAWCQKDSSCLEDFFTIDVVYRECYGPEYHGIEQILQWFKDWNSKGTVQSWDIKRMIVSGDIVVVEWHFCYCYDGLADQFEGVTIAEFQGKKIKHLAEYSSSSQVVYPYDNHIVGSI
ncbi:nuclear transport factor 2 family protein [Streptococcus merionis]|uniref:Limonene-1,2-epoxide hydrolase n=1 Tax=Streptococcus merionis TaxID=400065 RepID=A0A239SLY3_9STRE|nr:nuclear transport factor 2 family protein [Streptococcus merionis]SNU86445.1 Limonene-1,2-epoxide hydrolase [Streptococcus merionis]